VGTVISARGGKKFKPCHVVTVKKGGYLLVKKRVISGSPEMKLLD
jgi:hypothetical protein